MLPICCDVQLCTSLQIVVYVVATDHARDCLLTCCISPPEDPQHPLADNTACSRFFLLLRLENLFELSLQLLRVL